MNAKEISIAREEWGSFCCIWKKSPTIERFSLINEFIFDPVAFQTRIDIEKQRNPSKK